jgi:hypothetical protein
MGDPFHLVQVLILLGAANGAPVFATKLLGSRFAMPLDLRIALHDGRPVFGESKTLRGVVASVVCTSLVAAGFGWGWTLGAGVAVAAMAGDLFSSFCKRRLGLAPHAQALGLDQIPEALLPLLLFRDRLGLTWPEVVALVTMFLVVELLLSRLLFKLHIRDRPY